ncbi:Peptidyl-prolyl cis-trans isomerase fpr2 [Tulasnella sp. 424]|nr:Peptidyl-prolyl cis-trans isomerase fpr2 [Tulasnella sp. 424]KAG8970271.1 Peptidyl-prolyl cis-trans isomerase fpr2 [Tulasnella sp. 425]
MRSIFAIAFALSAALMASASEPKQAPEDLVIEKTHVPEKCQMRTRKGDQVVMHYRGSLFDTGKQFDASRDRGNQPFEFTLGAGHVTKGWDEGATNMCIGEKRTLTIPSHKAFGDEGYPPVIPEKAALVFEIELLDITGRDNAHEEL